MLWTVRHRYPAGARFSFNCNSRWVHLLLRQPGYAPVVLLIREGVTQVDPLSMVLYRTTLVPMAEYLMDADPTLMSPFYADDVVFYGPSRRSAAQLHLLMDWWSDRGYFPKPSELLFILDNPEEEGSTRREFERAGLNLNYIGGSQ